jgi:RNA polymerase sigma factor (sigma-70 family)
MPRYHVWEYVDPKSGTPPPAGSPAAMALENIGLVRFLGWRVRDRHDCAIDGDDICQEAFLGLMHAARKYQTDRARYSTYAGHWVRCYVRRAIRDTGSLIRVPEYLHDGMFNKQARIGNVRQAARILGACRRRLSLAEYGEVVRDRAAADPALELDRVEVAALVQAAVAQLPEPARGDLTLYFGLDGRKPLSRKAIAARRGISRRAIEDQMRVAFARVRLLLAFSDSFRED